jgi:putative membrane protein
VRAPNLRLLAPTDDEEARMSTHITKFALLGAAAAIAACSPRSDKVATNDSTSANGATPAASTPAADTTASAGSVANKPKWSDPNIVALVAEANKAEIAEGKLAEHKATFPGVKAFARKMVTDHTKMLDSGSALAKKLAITPDYPTDNDLRKDNQNELHDLTTKAAGKDWDSDYISKQIDDHKKVEDLLNDAIKSTQNTDLRNMLQQALPKVQEHRQLAESLKDSVKA